MERASITLACSAFLAATTVLVVSCSLDRRTQAPGPYTFTTLDRRSAYLKVHLKDGGLYILESWRVGVAGGDVKGRGRKYDLDRAMVASGEYSIPITSVALFETNVANPSPAIAAMAIMTGASATVSIHCKENPKDCYGSCPTFYEYGWSDRVPVAEGFSGSILPSLRETDVDALYRVRGQGNEVRLRMRDEALETQIVEGVRLLAVPRTRHQRVFATTAGEFRTARWLAAPVRCSAGGDDCLSDLQSYDGIERTSLADSEDLGARECIDLEFSPANAAAPGIVIASRQTLMTTYLFYQFLSFLGRDAGHWLASLERGDTSARDGMAGLRRELGWIEVWVQRADAKWERAGDLDENGPLASDVKVVPLGPTGAPVRRIRLRMSKGLWRLDWVALADLGDRVDPRRLAPSAVLRGGRPAVAALDCLQNFKPLSLSPGDEFELVFRTGTDLESTELFLETRGYYLEWMREEWLAEESPATVVRLFLDPRAALHELAPGFKRREAAMESSFWNSRIATR